MVLSTTLFTTSTYLFFLLILCCTPGKARSRIIDDMTRNNEQEVNYNFRYAVEDHNSGVYNDHWEHRMGDFVKGAYSLLDADGKIRTVYYEVDGKHGFRAYVKRKKPGPNFFAGQPWKEHTKPIITGKLLAKISI